MMRDQRASARTVCGPEAFSSCTSIFAADSGRICSLEASGDCIAFMRRAKQHVSAEALDVVEWENTHQVTYNNHHPAGNQGARQCEVAQGAKSRLHHSRLLVRRLEGLQKIPNCPSVHNRPEARVDTKREAAGAVGVC